MVEVEVENGFFVSTNTIRSGILKAFSWCGQQPHHTCFNQYDPFGDTERDDALGIAVQMN